MRGVLVDQVAEVMSVHPRTSTLVTQSARHGLYGRLYREIEYLCRRSKEQSGIYGQSELQTALWKMLVWDHELEVATGTLQRGTSLTQRSYSKCLPLFRSVEAYLRAKTHAERANAISCSRPTRFYSLLCEQWHRLQSSWYFFTFQPHSSTYIGRQWDWIKAIPRWILSKPLLDPLLQLNGSEGMQTTCFRLYMEGGTSIRSFLTASGYIGVGPADTEPKDFVCLLDGGRIAHVLRPRHDLGRGYSLQGGAYVHGIMDGEFYTEDRESVELELL